MESEVIFRRPGYEYGYRIGMDDDIISLYKEELNRSCACYNRSFILEVRTNFILKKTSSGEEIIGSERFADINVVNLCDLNIPVDEVELYLVSIDYRLLEYWLPEIEIRRIAGEAMCFVKRMAADPRNASLHVIPVVVYMDVCTVQLQGESLDAMILRSIKPDGLIPIQLWRRSIVQLGDGAVPKNSFMMEETKAMDVNHWIYMLSLPAERVEDVDDARMESCPVCSEDPTYGTLITRLPNCGHIFHKHCIVRCLVKNNKTCPACPSETLRSRELLALS